MHGEPTSNKNGNDNNNNNNNNNGIGRLGSSYCVSLSIPMIGPSYPVLSGPTALSPASFDVRRTSLGPQLVTERRC